MFRNLFLICFLIIYSCDLPSEANKDCNGYEGGLAQLDDCGICDGNNEDKDCLGVCFGSSLVDECGICEGNNSTCLGCDGIPNSGLTIDECGVCGGSNVCDCPGYPEGTIMDCLGQCNGTATIDDCGICEGNNAIYGCDGQCLNHIDDICGECNGPGVVGCMCESYIESNLEYDCSLTGSAPYQIGDFLSCETVQKEFGLCYPEDCDKTVKLADFEGKNILIIYEFDWWVACFEDISQLEEDIILEYIDHPDLAIINVINDPPGGKSCEIWGTGDEDYDNDDRVPIIINETNFGELGDFNNWFHNSGDWTAQYSSPWYIIIDSDFKFIDPERPGW